MKKYLFLILAIAFISCNDYGGERKDYLIDKGPVKTLPTGYAAAALGLAAIGIWKFRKRD